MKHINRQLEIKKKNGPKKKKEKDVLSHLESANIYKAGNIQ